MRIRASVGLAVVAALSSTLSISPAVSTDRQYPTLEIFHCGDMQLDDISSFSDTGEFDGMGWELVVPCYLIRHSNGLLVWDLGISSAMVEASADGTGGIRSNIEKSLAEGLAESGVAVSDIDFIAMSHMHPDHSGSANLFAGSATWLTGEIQYDFAFRDEGTTLGFDQNTYNDLKNGPVEFVQDGHDVFGDGTVLILSAPGHTPGHQVLFVDLEDYGPIVLSGDLHITRQSRELRLVPSFNYDRDMTLAAIDRIEAFMEERGAKMIIQHSIADYDSLPHAPVVLK